MSLVKVGDAVVDLHARAEGISNSIKEAIETGGDNGSKSMQKSFAGAFGSIAKIGGAAALAGTAAITTGVASLTKQAVSAYGQYEQLAGGIETLFGEAAPQAMKNAEAAFKSAGMSTNQYMETAIQSAAAMITSLDGDVQKSVEMVDLSITDMADNVNKMGTTMEAVQNAYRGFSRGNFTMLDNLALGFAGTKQGMQELLDKAQEISGIEYDIGSYADIVQAIHVVQEEMGITGTTQKEATDTIQGSLAMTRAAWENVIAGLANEDADMGELVRNLLDSVFGANGGRGLLDDIIPRISSALDGIIDFISEALPGLMDRLGQVTETYLPTFIGAIKNFLLSLSANLPTFASTLINIVSQLIQSLNLQLPALLGSALQGIIQLAFVVLENAPVLLDGILTLIKTVVNFILRDGLPIIIQALPGLITGIVDFIIRASTTITEAVFEIINAILLAVPDIIVALCSALPELIVGVATALVENAPLLSEAMLQLFIQSLVVIPQIIIEVVKRVPEIISAIGNSFKEQWPTIKTAGYELFEQAVSGMFGESIFAELGDSIALFIIETATQIKEGAIVLFDAGKDIMNGLIDGIKSKIQEINNVISGVATGISTAFKTLLGINSPSKIFEQFGAYIDEGLVIGLNSGTGDVLNATDDLAGTVTNGFQPSLLTPNYNRTPALAGVDNISDGPISNFGSITIPVYIGQKRIETIVVDALNVHNYITGGR